MLQQLSRFSWIKNKIMYHIKKNYVSQERHTHHKGCYNLVKLRVKDKLEGDKIK